MKLLRVIILLTVAGTVANAQAQDKKGASASNFSQTEIARVAAMLPERPTCFGRPITDRAAWETLAATSEGKGVIAAAETVLKTPMPEMTDEIYLIYSRTGSRTEGDRIDGQRRGRIGTLTLAELLENKGRFLPELEKTIRSLCDREDLGRRRARWEPGELQQEADHDRPVLLRPGLASGDRRQSAGR